MPAELSPIDKAKFVAARRAVDFVEDGLKLGLGTGSTAVFMVRRLAERVQAEGLQMRYAATSQATAALAESLGLKIEALDDIGWLDMTLDGADEVNPDLNLIKGGGAALLREKIVAFASDRMVVMADGGKVVETLGAFLLPVEVIPFGWQTTRQLVLRVLADLDLADRAVVRRMRDGAPVLTDEGNYILDLALEAIPDPAALSVSLNALPGVVENGLFLGICDLAIIGKPDGSVVELMAEEIAE